MKKAIFFIKRDELMDKVFEAFKRNSEVRITEIVKKFATAKFYNTILKDIKEINKVVKFHIPEMELFKQHVKREKDGRAYKVLIKHPHVKITATGNYFIIEANEEEEQHPPKRWLRKAPPIKS